MVAFEWESSGLLRKFSGEVSFADLLLGYEQGIADPRFETIHYIINDFSACASLTLSHQEITEAIEKSKTAEKWPGRYCVALVIGSQQTEAIAEEYVAARMTHSTVRVFKSLDAAREWVAQWKPRL